MSTRRGFTLVELMVVIGIMALLAVVTLVSVNFSFSRDKTREGARQIQSFLMGARDRAIHAKEARGVRFLLAPNDKHTAVAMQYIGAGDRWSQKQVTFVGTPLTGGYYESGKADVIEILTIRSMFQNGIVTVGSKIEIPSGSGSYYAISSTVFSITDDLGASRDMVRINKDCAAFNGPNSTASYNIFLASNPTSEPVLLPTGVAIDLDGSQVPLSWRPSSADTTKAYRPTLDILFNPRGNVIGDVASGTVHLLLADTGDISKWKQITGRDQRVSPSNVQWAPPAVPVNPPGVTPPVVTRDQMVVTIRGNTGAVSVHSVNPTPSSTNTAIADDPFSFADSGISAK